MVKLIIGNLPPSSTSQSLKEIFYQYEDLTDYKLISDYGFVYLESEASANHALNYLNGFVYRGYQITVDYASDGRDKQNSNYPIDSNAFVGAPLQNRFLETQNTKRPQYPFNFNYPNKNINNKRQFDISSSQSMKQQLNMNPYNIPYGNQGYNINNNMSNIRNCSEYGQDYQQPAAYGSNQCGIDYYSPQDGYYPYNEQNNELNGPYGLEEEYYTPDPPMKRMRESQLMDNNVYTHVPRKSIDYAEDEFRSYRYAQPSFYEKPKMPIRPPLRYPRDEPYYYPNGKKIFRPKRSYIDEYEDDFDYGAVDPYPSYLKQYKKQ